MLINLLLFQHRSCWINNSINNSDNNKNDKLYANVNVAIKQIKSTVITFGIYINVKQRQSTVMLKRV